MSSYNYSYKNIIKTQKKVEAFWTIIIDPIALFVLEKIARYKKIKPNHITILSLLCGLGASYLFSEGDFSHLVFGALLFESSFILDAVDGKLARLRNEETIFGMVLDKIRDKTVHILCTIGLVVGQIRLGNGNTYILLGVIYTFFLFVNSSLSFLYSTRKFVGKKDYRDYITFTSSTKPLEVMPTIAFRNRKTFFFPSIIEASTILFFVAPLLQIIFAGFVFAIVILVGLNVRLLDSLRKSSV